jgi:hypothetical protein
MRVLFVSGAGDWANVGHTFAESLEAVGIRAEAATRNLHPHEYNPQAKPWCCHGDLAKMGAKADIIVFMHSTYIKPGSTAGKRLFAFHGGSKYRYKHDEVVNVFKNVKIEKHLIQTCELFGLGLPREEWILPGVNTKRLRPDYSFRDWNKVTIGHFPNGPEHKNTAMIRKVIHRLQADPKYATSFLYLEDDSKVTWDVYLDRLRMCDILLDQFNWLGCWGVTSLEAAALGCVVVTDFYDCKGYIDLYKEPPCLYPAHLEYELMNQLKYLLSITRAELLSIKQDTRVWVETAHSLRATGRRLKEVMGI